MKKSLLFCWFIHVCLLPCYSQDLSVQYGSLEFSIDEGENWTKNQPDTMGVFRFRFPIDISGSKSQLDHYGLYVWLLAASEMYWDDVLIGRNGVVGASRATEKPGLFNASFLIPDSLMSNGQHWIEGRFSNFYAGNNFRFYGVWITNYIDPIIWPLSRTVFMHVFAGFFLIIGLFYSVRYFADRSDPTRLVFAIICIAFFALVVMEYIKYYYFYSYSWHFTRLRIILTLTQLIGISLPLYYALRFKFKSYYWLLFLQGLIYIGLIYVTKYGYDYATNLSMVVAYVLAAGICTYAFQKRLSGSQLSLFGVLPVTFSLITYFSHYDTINYIGFAILVMTILIDQVLQEKELNKQKEEALLLSSRLELELLKKNIQPHFLMNSIASAIDWMEENPKDGVQLLLELSKEFEILFDISGKKLIPVSQELALCRAHLRIMEFRKMQKYTLSAENVNENAMLPPAVFLTVIENGISHQATEGQPLSFELLETSEIKNTRNYKLLARGPIPHKSTAIKEGTGLRYIKARLEESFPKRWSFENGPTAEGWMTEIKLSEV